MGKLTKQQGRSGYEQVPNELIRNASFRATGLWAYMAQLPDDWDFSIRGIATLRKEGVDVIRNTMTELEELGYLKRERVRVEGKLKGSNYELIWTPKLEKPTQEKPTQAKPTQENTTQYKTEQQKTEKTKDLTKNIPEQCFILADILRSEIIKRYPNNRVASNYRQNWAIEIDKMIRIDKRKYGDIEACIYWAFNVSDFWHRQIWSGANLRKHFDRMSAQAQAELPKLREAKKKQLAHDMAMDKITVEEYDRQMAMLGKN